MDAGELGPKMQTCSERERKFVWAYLVNGGNGTEAARTAGYADPGLESSSIRVRAHALMHRPRVLDAIREVASTQLVGLVGPAIAALEALIRAKEHPDHVKAIGMVLNRTGFAERTAVDVNVGGTVTLNHTDAAVQDLRILKEMGVSRDKLVETFGASGLDRYEGMLAEQDGKRLGGPVIEHDSGEAIR